jgi:HSP20 family protein
MKPIIPKYNQCAVYPGIYVPLVDEKTAKKNLILLRKINKGLSENIKVTELENLFKVEIAAPGARREEFSVCAEGNTLRVTHIQNHKITKGTFELNDVGGFDRKVVLPKNANTEFMSAECKEGVLQMMVPKSKNPADNNRTTIVVY